MNVTSGEKKVIRYDFKIWKPRVIHVFICFTRANLVKNFEITVKSVIAFRYLRAGLQGIEPLKSLRRPLEAERRGPRQQ
jgi:hypothetical protein